MLKKLYDAKLSDGSTLRVAMGCDPQTGATHVWVKYPVGNRRWPEGHENSWYYGTYPSEGVLRAGGKVERFPHDLIADVQLVILRDWLCHLISWIEV